MRPPVELALRDCCIDLGLGPSTSSHRQRCPSATTPSTGPVPNGCNPIASASRLRGDQTVTNQTPIDRRPTRQRHHAFPVELMTNRTRTPPRLLTAHLHDPRLDLRRHLMRTRQRLRRAIHQTRQPIARVPTQPNMHRLPRHPIAAGHIGDGRSVVDHLEHRLQALFHNTQLHEHHGPPRSQGPYNNSCCTAARKRQEALPEIFLGQGL